jgi:ABC-type sugar transport system ATPase subunit
MNFVPVAVVSQGEGFVVVSAPEVGLRDVSVAVRGKPPALGARAVLGVRPEHFVRGDEGEARFEGMVSVVERLGGLTYVHASLSEGTALTVESRDPRGFEVGTAARFAFDARRALLFDAAGQRL